MYAQKQWPIVASNKDTSNKGLMGFRGSVALNNSIIFQYDWGDEHPLTNNFGLQGAVFLSAIEPRRAAPLLAPLGFQLS